MPDNKPQWTPGPWGNDLPWAVTQNGRVILTTAVDIPTTGEAEAIANATLAAAAPDLWKALAKLIDTLTWAGLKNPTLPFSLVAEDVLQAAIALRKANPQRTQEQKDDAA